MNVLKDLVDGRNLADIFDEGLDHINEDESIKELLAKKIGEDIVQYLDSDTWGDEKPTIEVIGDDAYLIYGRKMMKPLIFYSCVFNNMGKVTKENFILNAEEKEKTAED